MFSKKTVFIIGAGASISYGFPSGKQLKNNILNMSIVEAEAELEHVINVRRGGLYKQFIEELRDSESQSIDTFWEHKKENEDYQTIGKLLIGLEILKCEYEHENNRKSRKQEIRPDDWCQYFIGKLMPHFEKLEKEQVTFLTFNYDRSLEYQLYKALKARNGLSEQETFKKLSKMPIIHLHGSIGELDHASYSADYIPYAEFKMNSGPFKRKTSENSTVDEPRSDFYNRVISNIKIVHEDGIQDSKEFKEAHGAINSSKQVVLLGFGYLEDNIRRLKLSTYATSKKVLATSYEMRESEFLSHTKSIRGSYVKITTPGERADCLEFFRTNNQIFD